MRIYLLNYKCTCLLTYLLIYLHTYLLALTYLPPYLLTLTYVCTYMITYSYLLNYILTYLITYINTSLLTYILTYLLCNTQTCPQWICKLLVAATTYFHTCPFYWMFVEGLYLFTIVVWAFSTQKLRLWYYLIIGWSEYRRCRSLSRERLCHLFKA